MTPELINIILYSINLESLHNMYTLFLQFDTVDLQMVLVTDEVDTYVMYIYGDMQWGISPQVSKVKGLFIHGSRDEF